MLQKSRVFLAHGLTLKRMYRMDENMTEYIRIATVTDVNYSLGTVDVIYPDRDNSASLGLQLLSAEFNPPQKGDMVLVILLPGNTDKGFVIGKPFNINNPPISGGDNIIRKDYIDGNYIEYNKSSKTLLIKANHIVLTGDLMVNGNVNIIGNLDVSGYIHADGGTN